MFVFDDHYIGMCLSIRKSFLQATGRLSFFAVVWRARTCFDSIPSRKNNNNT